MPLSNIWVPRRDSRGLFVPKRPHTSLSGGNMSTTAQWANWIYPVPTRGIYASAVDEIGVLGNYGGTADRTPTPYGLGINTPDGWEWGRSGVLTPGGFNQTRQTLFSVFYLYDATKLTTTNRYINLGVGRSREVASVASIDETGLFWSNQAGEQAIYATTATVSFGGTNASVTGVGNGLHCIVATYTVNGNLELYLDGSLVSTGVTGTYAVAWTNLPNFFFGGLGPANQNVGTILLAGTVYGQIFDASAVRAFTADPFGYFFVDAPSVSRTSFYYAPLPATLAYIYPRKTLTQQPQGVTEVDRTNKLGRDISFLWNASELNIDSAKNLSFEASFSDLPEDRVLRGSDRGRTLTTENTSLTHVYQAFSRYSSSNPIRNNGSDWTFGLIFKTHTLDFESPYTMYISSDQSPNNYHTIRYITDSTTPSLDKKVILDYQITGGGGTTQTLYSDNTYNGDTWLSVVVVMKQGDVHFYINGVRQSQNSTTSFNSGILNDVTFDVAGKGKILTGFTSRSVWSQNDVNSWTENPWQLFAPTGKRYFSAPLSTIVPPSGGGNNFFTMFF